MRKGMKVALLAGLLGLATFVAAAQAMHFTAWTTAQKIDEIAGNSSELNTPSQDGCPIQSPDGLSLYMASNRPGGKDARHLGCPAREHGCALGGARRISASRSTRPPTTSARRPSAEEASSS